MIDEILNEVTNYHGKLPPNSEVRGRIKEFFTTPSEENWDRIAHLIINDKSIRARTMWQAVRRIDPSFPSAKRTDRWESVPSVFVVARAIKEAVQS